PVSSSWPSPGRSSPTGPRPPGAPAKRPVDPAQCRAETLGPSLSPATAARTAASGEGHDVRLHPSDKFDNSAKGSNLIEARPLAAAMGAEIAGVDIVSMTDEQFEEVRAALFRHKMIYFRNQKLTHGDQEAFSLRFGPFAEDAYTSGVPGHRNVHPLIKEAD